MLARPIVCTGDGCRSRCKAMTLTCTLRSCATYPLSAPLLRLLLLPQAGTLHLRLEQVNMGDLMRRLVSSQRESLQTNAGAHKRGIQLTLQVHPQALLMVTADGARLRQAVANLLAYAVQSAHHRVSVNMLPWGCSGCCEAEATMQSLQGNIAGLRRYSGTSSSSSDSNLRSESGATTSSSGDATLRSLSGTSASSSDRSLRSWSAASTESSDSDDSPRKLPVGAQSHSNDITCAPAAAVEGAALQALIQAHQRRDTAADSSDRKAACLRVEITYDGPGLSPTTAKRMFLPTANADNSVDPASTTSSEHTPAGLRLSIAGAFILLFGGRVGATRKSSAPLNSALFIELPATALQPHSESTAAGGDDLGTECAASSTAAAKGPPVAAAQSTSQTSHHDSLYRVALKCLTTVAPVIS